MRRSGDGAKGWTGRHWFKKILTILPPLPDFGIKVGAFDVTPKKALKIATQNNIKGLPTFKVESIAEN